MNRFARKIMPATFALLCLLATVGAIAQRPTAASKPVPTPPPYVDNQPLPADLGFDLGETLTYRVSNGEKPIAEIIFHAKERKLIGRQDSLVLSATVTSAEDGNGVLRAGDSILAHVDPETLTPFELSITLSNLTRLNQNARFDQNSGTISFGSDRVDAPIGTHCILSFLYAIRSFNLMPTKDASNPINDTRVAVYWEGKPYIFMLRPSEFETITVNGKKVSAQRVTIKTGVPQIDALGLKIWLSSDDDRAPLQINLGSYKAELIQKNQQRVK